MTKCVEQDEAGAGMKFYWGIIGKLIAVFVFSFGVYQVVNKIVLSVLGIETTPYITEQVMWGNASVAECVSDIIEHIKEVLLGDGLFFTEAMGIIYVIVLIYSIARIREKKKCYFMYLLALAFCMISPFLYDIASRHGTDDPGRDYDSFCYRFFYTVYGQYFKSRFRKDNEGCICCCCNGGFLLFHVSKPAFGKTVLYAICPVRGGCAPGGENYR